MADESPERSRVGGDAVVHEDRSISPKQVATAALVVVVVLFALLNLQGVSMNWVVGTTHTPLIVVVAVCSLIGLAVGFLIGRRRRTPAGSGDGVEHGR